MLLAEEKLIISANNIISKTRRYFSKHIALIKSFSTLNSFSIGFPYPVKCKNKGVRLQYTLHQHIICI